jgi:hypothetical protein
MDSLIDRRVVSLSPDRLVASQIAPLPSGELRIEQFLLGRTRGEGLFQDFTGRIRRRFAITLDGRMESGVLVLTEDFLFDDGQTERRVWRISPQADGAYSATADDMIGEARGAQRAGALRWSYLFSLKLGARRLRVRFRDTFVQVADDALLNEARVTKFGLELGRTTIIIRRDI